MNKNIFSIFIILIFISGCTPNNNSTTNAVNEFTNETLPNTIAELPIIELSTIDNFDKYKQFAENMNNMIRILNENSEIFNIPYFEKSQESFEKLAKYTTEYGPLVGSYNNLIYISRAFTFNKNEQNLKNFYAASGKFAFETTTIIVGTFYVASYKTVGYVYKISGLNRLALKCGECVSIILSDAHWAIRTFLVTESSKISQIINSSSN